MTGAEIFIIGALVAGTAIQAYGQYQAGKAADQQSKAEAAWHNYNAQVAKREAEAEREATRAQATQQAKKAKAFQARQFSLIGASGVNIEGSPLLVVEDTAEQLKLEEIDILKHGARRASFYESQSILDTFSAGATRSRGSAARSAGRMGAFGSILTGAASAGLVAGRFSGTSPAGTFQSKTGMSQIEFGRRFIG